MTQSNPVAFLKPLNPHESAVGYSLLCNKIGGMLAMF